MFTAEFSKIPTLDAAGVSVEAMVKPFKSSVTLFALTLMAAPAATLRLVVK